LIGETNHPSACCLGLDPVAGLLASDDLSVGVISTSRRTTERETVPTDHAGPIHPLMDFSLHRLHERQAYAVRLAPHVNVPMRASFSVFALSVPGMSKFMS